MAKEAGLQMPDTTLLEGKNGRYFACARFDRVGDTRVHMHSVAGLVHSDFRYPSLDYDDLMSLSLYLTKNAQEVQKVFRLACFNLFAHNRDDHAKTFRTSWTKKEHGTFHLCMTSHFPVAQAENTARCTWEWVKTLAKSIFLR